MLSLMIMPTTLLHLLSIYPIVESLASQLGSFDLVSLSRASCSFRVVLRGLEHIPNCHPTATATARRVRSELRIDDAKTAHWLNLRGKCRDQCAECHCDLPFDLVRGIREGSDISPCVLCAKPICVTCYQYSRMWPPGDDGAWFAHHYIARCIKCCPDEKIEQVWYRDISARCDRRKWVCWCIFCWPPEGKTRVCLDCRARMREERDKGVLLGRLDGVPARCASVGCGTTLRAWRRPWGRRCHVVCIFCGIPREAEVPLLV